MSLHIIADSPEPQLLAYTMYGYKLSLKPEFGTLAHNAMSALVFIRGSTGPYTNQIHNMLPNKSELLYPSQIHVMRISLV